MHEARSLVEEAFKVGAVRALTATSTLAAGINLPVARVILRYAVPMHAIKLSQNCQAASLAVIF